MAWSWSHTHEAYENARNNLERLPREKLEVIYAEWLAAEGDIHFCPRLNDRRYLKALHGRAKQKTTEELVEFIWEKASEFATCTNGGWQAYMCPFGCGCHMVSFSPEEEEVEA